LLSIVHFAQLADNVVPDIVDETIQISTTVVICPAAAAAFSDTSRLAFSTPNAAA